MQIGIQKKMVPHIPWGMLGTALAIASLGVWNLASASRGAHPLWPAQALYIGVGLALAAGVVLLDYKFIYRMAIPVYALNIAALVALRFFGHRAKGAESWFAIGGLHIQPSEFMKIGVILMLAKIYHDDFRPTQEAYGLLRVWKPLVVALVPAALVLVQPALGTAIMLVLASATVILFGKITLRLGVVIGVAVLSLSFVIWNDYVRETPEPHRTFVRHLLKPYQSQRISGWLQPDSDLKGSNYHTAQSKIAVGSGGMFGKGWQQGTQTALSFLPEQHTDFIFSVWAEEHGFFACLLLLGLYGLLLFSSLRAAFLARDRFGAFVAVGIGAVFFWAIFQNIGMVAGLLPVTGCTLPLMSYGGSSVLACFLMLGILANISLRRHIF